MSCAVIIYCITFFLSVYEIIKVFNRMVFGTLVMTFYAVNGHYFVILVFVVPSEFKYCTNHGQNGELWYF